MLSMIGEIIRDLFIFVAVMFALFIVLLVVISKMPDDNPLKRILTALSYRVGATLAAGVVAVPIEPIPGLDVFYDIGVPILLIWYWFTFFRDTVPLSAPFGTAHRGDDVPSIPSWPTSSALQPIRMPDQFAAVRRSPKNAAKIATRTRKLFGRRDA